MGMLLSYSSLLLIGLCFAKIFYFMRTGTWNYGTHHQLANPAKDAEVRISTKEMKKTFVVFSFIDTYRDPHPSGLPSSAYSLHAAQVEEIS